MEAKENSINDGKPSCRTAVDVRKSEAFDNLLLATTHPHDT